MGKAFMSVRAARGQLQRHHRTLSQLWKARDHEGFRCSCQQLAEVLSVFGRTLIPGGHKKRGSDRGTVVQLLGAIIELLARSVLEPACQYEAAAPESPDITPASAS